MGWLSEDGDGIYRYVGCVQRGLSVSSKGIDCPTFVKAENYIH